MVINPKFILLLGSYDHKTKPLIHALKDEIPKTYIMDSVFGLVLDNLEVYRCDNSIHCMTELYENTLTIMRFKGNELVDVEDITSVDITKVDTVVLDYLRSEHGIKQISKLPVISKLQYLMEFSRLIVLLREVEQTRGGEYLELVHAISKNYESKILFLYNKDIALSGMLKEYLDAFAVRTREYSTKDELIEHALRYIRYQVVTPVNK